MDPVKVGKSIKTLRANAGYTQHQLAELMGVTDQAVSKWERGLSVPDVSIVTRLSVFLNVDVDNLLEGNITYLEKTWQGLLILRENRAVFSGSEIYGKPLVYFLLSYFILAGVRNIHILCDEKDKRAIGEQIGDGSRYGIRLFFLNEEKELKPENTMVIYDNPFLFGPNLTKYFQRAMSRLNGISVLTISKAVSGNEMMVSYNNHRAVQEPGEGGVKQCCAPVIFFPKAFFDQVKKAEQITSLEPLYAEPMGNGMIGYSVLDEDALWYTSFFLRYMKSWMGKDLYDLAEVARNRNFTEDHSLNNKP